PQSHAQNHHLRDGRALRSGVSQPAGEIRDVRRPPRTEQRTQYTAHDTSRPRPYSTELPRGAPAESDVERMDADAGAQGEEREGPGKLNEQRQAQGEAQEGEGNNTTTSHRSAGHRVWTTRSVE